MKHKGLQRTALKLLPYGINYKITIFPSLSTGSFYAAATNCKMLGSIRCLHLSKLVACSVCS